MKVKVKTSKTYTFTIDGVEFVIIERSDEYECYAHYEDMGALDYQFGIPSEGISKNEVIDMVCQNYEGGNILVSDDCGCSVNANPMFA